MNLKRNAVHFYDNAVDSAVILHNRRHETKKYEDPRRKAVWSKVELSAEERQAVDEFYLRNYGKKIPLTWHRAYTAFTGNFDVQYFPELLYVPEFEYFENMLQGYIKAVEDKHIISSLAKESGVRTPEIYLSRCRGMFLEEDKRIITEKDTIGLFENIGAVFCKPGVDSDSGRGCFKAEMHNGIDEISGRTAKDLLKSLGNDFLVQECIRSHESVSAFHPQSVNTFRILTYRWRDDLFHFPITMRIGRSGNCVDNAHSGGIFVGVEDSGALKKQAFSEFCDIFSAHPDTGVVFEERCIPTVPDVLNAAYKMHASIPQLGCINWDFTVAENGEPVLIEANVTAGGGIWLSQMAHGAGPFGEKTAEVLRWLRLVKQTPVHRRKKYAYGFMDNP